MMVSLSFSLLLFTLAFAPLAFGTVEHWSLMSVELLAGLSCFICLVGLRLSGEPFHKVPGLVPLVLILGLMLVQCIPLPPDLLKLISFGSWQAYLPASEQMHQGAWLPLTVNQKATFQEFLRIGAYGLFYILTVQVLRSGPRIVKTLQFVVLLAGIIAFVAILQQFTADGMIYWFRYAPGDKPGGPWVYINQYAAFMEGIAPLILALVLFYQPAVHEETTFRERFVSFFSSPRSNLHLFVGFAYILVVASVFITLCRGGIITILLSLILFMLLLGFRKRDFSKITYWFSVCLVLLTVTWFGWQPIVEKFDKTFDVKGGITETRLVVWEDSLGIVKDYPVLGSGFGTYIDVYPSYRTVPGISIFDHAHNDYLELLTDGGFTGFWLGAWFCLTVLLHGWKRVRLRNDRFAILVGIGAITSISALLIHAIFDFHFHNGAVGLYFFFLCGLLVAAVNNRYSYYEAESLLGTMGEYRGLSIALVSLIFVGIAGVTQFSILVAGNSYNKVKHIYVSSHLAPHIMDAVAGGIEQAMVFDPLEGVYPFHRGNLEVIRGKREQAYNYFLLAQRRQPLEGIYLQHLAMMLPEEKREEAEALMLQGYRKTTYKDRVALSWAEWLLVTGRRDQAKTMMRERFEKEPGDVVKVIPILDNHQFTREEVGEVLPSSVDAWIRFADFKEQMGEIEEAGYYRREALEYIEEKEEIKPGWYTQLISYYRRHGWAEAALEVLRQGVKKCPDYAPFRVQLGDHYRKEGITYRAKEEYERALMIEPGNEGYRRKLRKLELDIEFGTKPN